MLPFGVDVRNKLRHGQITLFRNLPQRFPEPVLKANAGFVAAKPDRAPYRIPSWRFHWRPPSGMIEKSRGQSVPRSGLRPGSLASAESEAMCGDVGSSRGGCRSLDPRESHGPWL